MLRLVSSEDVGHDEASVQSLVKKHKVGLLHLSVFIQFAHLDLHCFDTVSWTAEGHCKENDKRVLYPLRK